MLSTIIGTVVDVVKATGLGVTDIAKVGGAFLITPPGAAVGLAALISGYALKRIDNKWVYKPIYGVCYGVCVAVTLGASKWPYIGKAWNKTIEPFVIDLLDNILSAVKDGCFDGLHSDNK